MSELGKKILSQGYCVDTQGKQVRLHSNTTLEQCEYLVRLLKETNAKQTLEVGVAFGLSALFITEYIKSQNGCHILIDPYQRDQVWQGIGLQNLQTAGLEPFSKFYEEDARTALPRLADQGLKLDFAYIDASKRLDDTLIFFFFIFRMLKVGGIIVFDDVAWFPGISTALRYILGMPGVKFHSATQSLPSSWKRSTVETLLNFVPYSGRLFREEWTTPSQSLGINAGAVAIQKVSDDIGSWDYHPAR